MSTIIDSSGDCNAFLPVTFGFDTCASCWFHLPALNCSESRIQLETKLNDLFTGDLLSPYRPFSPPYLHPVSILRKTDSGTCQIPESIELLILFTAIPIDGRFVYRIVGANISLGYRNFLPTADHRLTASVRFIRVPFHLPAPLSRFWEKIFSREESSFAWLNLFNAFDGGLNGDETEEATFWTGLFLIVFITVLILTRNNV